jgi:ABC-type transport system involved in multi-copper enzyme maturation permease subunit
MSKQAKAADAVKLLKLSLLVQLGRRYWLLLAFVLAWPLALAVVNLLGWYNKNFGQTDVQNLLLGIPLYLMAIGIGIRVIANEIEQRTLEVAYTIPSGAKRVWLYKLISATLMLLCAELVLALVIWLFFAPFTVAVLYGTLQGAVFYLVLSMLAGVIVKNELAAVLITLVFGFFNLKNTQSRWSPLFNPLESTELGSTELFAWTMQNHIGFGLIIVALCALAFAGAQRREKLLG